MTYDTKIKILATINHIALLIVLVWLFSWWWLLAGFILHTIFITVGISVGYHRYFTHKSFTANNKWEWAFIILGSLSFLGPVLGWVGIHRTHHAFSDTEKDPHSPYNGFFKSLFHIFTIKSVKLSFVSDLIRNKKIMLQHKYYFHSIFLYSLVMALIFGYNAIYLVSIPAVLGYYAAGITNSVNHLFGKQVDIRNMSTNLPIANIITGGEGYHANHHASPNSHIFGKWDPARLIFPFIK